MYKVYGTSVCPWCERVKELLTQHGKEFEYINLENDVEAQKMFKEKRFKTVPQVFLDGELVGGFEAVKHSLECPKSTLED